MERKRLRVEGIPTDIPTERAKDKLIIHFLRTRNGGGEVEDVQIFPGPPVYAIITFEEEKVVDRVLNIKHHVLKINDKIYNLEVSKAPGKWELDEVFKRSSLSVNYKILPEKLKNILKGLRETYKGVKFDFDEKSGNCEISGSYTKIQKLSQEIIKNFELGHGSLKEESKNTHSQTEFNQITRKHSDVPVVSQVGDQTSSRLYASSKQGSFLTRGETTLAKEKSLVSEPFVWDSDIFKYIQKMYSSQYRKILDEYNVEAVEESSEDITTIILQTLGDNGCMTNLRDAQIGLMELYQGFEQILRKEQIDKRPWNGDKYFHRRLLKDVKTLFPALLCHENDQYIFLIGDGADVAQGKQYITDQLLQLNNPTSLLSPYDIEASGGRLSTAGSLLSTSGGQLSTKGGQRDSMSFSYKHESYENKGGSKIAATFNPPIGNSSYMMSQLDKKCLWSSSSDSKHHTDLGPSLGSYKTLGTVEFASSAYLNTPEDFSISQVNEEKSGKDLAHTKKMDILPSLKTGRIDIRQSKSTTKSVEKNKPVRIPIASSELPFSSLVDIVPQSIDFKPAEVKLRRSNSFSNVYARNSSSDPQDGTTQMKEEIFFVDWLWHYIKVFHKSDIDTWCAEVTLTEETYKDITTVTLKALSQTTLWSAKQKIQLLYMEKRGNLTKSSFQYSTLGVKGPDDSAIKEWCNVLCSCSDKLCVKLEKGALLLIYPKVIEKKVLEECDRVLSNKYPNTISLADDGNSSLGTITKEQQPDFFLNTLHSHQNNFFNDPEDLKYTEDQKASLLDGKNERSTDDKAPSSFFPPLQDENIHKPLQMQGTQDYLISDISLKDPDRPRSKSPNLQNYQEHVYNSSLAQTVDSSSNMSELRKPAVGQESDPVDRVCDNCKRNGKASTLVCGHHVCESCHSTFVDSCLVCTEKNRNTLNAKITYRSMSLSLSGYERSTCIKVKYEVPDGVQGEEDPHPGKPYKGGTFEAYLPENKEGRKLLSLFQQALKHNLTFHIKATEAGDVVTWYAIPHKTSPDGGRLKNGYPDSQYLKTTIDLMKNLRIE